MNNLQHLYNTDIAFQSIVDEAAAAAIGSSSEDFAHEWLALDCHCQKAASDDFGPQGASDGETPGGSLETRVPGMGFGR